MSTTTRSASRRQQAGARPVLLLLVTFLLGVGAGGIWLYRPLRPTAPAEADGNNASGLTESTLATLKGLDAPLNIRYYAVIDQATIGATVSDYAERVRALLNQYQSEGNGRVNVARLDSRTDAVISAAVADGMKPFNVDRGEVSYLGLLFSYKGRTEAIPLLSTEWERALESDITRAIARLTAVKPVATRSTEAPVPNAAAIAEVKSIIPNVGSLSEDECKRMLQEKALTALTAVSQEAEAKVKEAEQRLVAAQKDGSDATILEARSSLQKAQLQQAERIKDVAAQLQEHLAALKLIKSK